VVFIINMDINIDNFVSCRLAVFCRRNRNNSRHKIYFFIFPLIFLVGFLFIGVQKVNAATWYVSTTGTDDASHGTGTGANAWLTLDYALTGSRVAKGDTVIIEAGTYSSFNGAHTYLSPVINTASGSGPVIIQAADGATVTLDVPSNSATNMAFFIPLSTQWGEFTFKHINFTNSNNVATRMFWTYGHNLTLEDCTITLSAVNTHAFWIGADTEDANLTLTRTTVIGSPTLGNFVFYVAKAGANVTVDSSTFYDQTTYIFSPISVTGVNFVIKNSKFYNQTSYIFITSSAANLTIESSLFYDQTTYLFYLNAATNFTATNCTFFTSSVKVLSQAASSGSTYNFKNNIFYADTTSDNRPFAMGDAIAAEIIATPAYWNVTNNVWYRASGYQQFISGNNHFEQVDATNHFIDPQFTATSTNDFTIQNGSYVCGHGLQASLPASGDVTGAAWTGNDVGAYKCPSSSTGVTLLDKVAFVGDSIMLSTTIGTEFNSQTGLTVATQADTAISGAYMQKIFASIDTVMINTSPSTVFLSIGINNLATVSPSAATTDEYVDYLSEMMQKIEDWGATPIWLGIGTLNDINGYDDESVTAINAAMETECTSHGWTCDSYYDQMTLNSNWQSASPDGYYDTDGNVHPNTAGYTLIGDFAEYLYYDHHTIGTDEIDIGAGARIYANGKFRDHETTSGTTADLAVTPAWGSSFTTGDQSQWMDINIDSWLTSGTYNKQWTATSTVATTTIYTIGDLAANKYYQFQVDGVASTTAVTNAACTSGICKADSSGNLTFTYTGGYSTHTFALVQNTTAPTNIGLTSVTADSASQLTVLANTATDADPGLSATPYWFDETTSGSGATDSSTWQASATYIDSSLSANTQYTYRVKAKDGNDNESSYSTTLSKYTLAPTPTSFSATAGLSTVSLSVDSFNNASSGSSGYYFSRSGANSGWITTNSWQDTSLSCGTSYTYSIKYRNGDGTETDAVTITKSTSVCGGGGVSGYTFGGTGSGQNDYYVPMGQSREIPYIGDAGVNIFTYINSPLVFSFENSKSKYNLQILELDTNNGLIKAQLGAEIFYLSPNQTQSFDLDGNRQTDLRINYKQLKVNQIILALDRLNPSMSQTTSFTEGSLVKTPDDPAVYLIENGYRRHIVDAETFLAKGFSWSDIKDAVNLDSYPLGKVIGSADIVSPPAHSEYSFSVDMKLGDFSDDVLNLQKFLNANGFIVAGSGPGSPGQETKFFGRATKAALIKFQNKYKKEILDPQKLKNGTGYFGPATREFIENNFSF